jgi:hypothetical protein
LLEDFGVFVSMSTPLLSDNIYAISIARDLVEHEVTNHIGVDAYYTQAQDQDGVITIQYVLSELQLVDFFMKTQTCTHYQFYLSKLNVLIHRVFEGTIRCIIAFYIYVFLQGFFVYFTPHVHLYIRP